MSSKQPPLERDARLQETRCLFLPGLVAVRDGRTAAGPGISDEASTTHVSCADGTHSVGSGLLRLPPPLPPSPRGAFKRRRKRDRMRVIEPRGVLQMELQAFDRNRGRVGEGAARWTCFRRRR
ncbi:hypothetical protein GW17_00021224 [Ensete ventricosum]|nr:hypothetical protein GW17_00021224 [Ensete ventricosum]RZS18671.1 hypothetical protein BHM03_00050985 [Ensete ventricosum]